MIVIDSSAVFAVVLNEPEAARFGRIMLANPCVIGAPTRVEVHLVARSRGPDVVADVTRFFDDVAITVIPFDARMEAIAREAFDRYRTGRRRLNYGDCLSYAVAKALDAPLLYKGLDFEATDVTHAAR